MTKLKTNLIFQIVYQVMAVLQPLITTPIILRALGADGMGQYSYTQAVVNFFALFILLGVKNYGTRVISRANVSGDQERINRTFSEIYSLQLFLAAGIIVLYYALVPILFSKYLVLSLVQGSVLFLTAMDVTWFYFGIENFKKTVIRDSMVRISAVFLIIFLIKKQSDLYTYVAIILLSTLASNLYLLFSLRKNVQFKIVPFQAAKTHFLPNLALFIPVVAASLYMYMDKIMLGSISGSIQGGYYDSMEKIISVPTSCLNALMLVMFPRMSALMEANEEEQVNRYLNISTIGVGLCSMLFIGGIVSVADLFVPIYMGKEFAPAAVTLQIGALLILPRGIRGLINLEYLLPSGKDREVIITILTGTVVNLVLNLVLMPTYGANGAIAATVICEFVSCILAMWYARQKLKPVKVLGLLLPSVLVSGVMMAVVRMVNAAWSGEGVMKLFAMICAGAGSFLAIAGIAVLGYLAIRKYRKQA